MAMKLYSDTAIQDIADAIRSKNGSSDTYTVAEMAQAIEDIETGGGGYDIDDIVNRTPEGAFTLTTASVYERALFKYAHITSLESTTVRTLQNYACASMTRLVSVNFPNANAGVGTYTFQDCSALTNVHLPEAKTFGGYNFYNCSSLVTLALPSITSGTGADFIRGCSKLTTLDLGAPTQLPALSLRNAGVFSTLILRKESAITTLANVSAFSSTPFASGGSGGTLYVPQALISSYQSATNWSTILGYANNQILPIEGSIYETQYADGTPIE